MFISTESQATTMTMFDQQVAAARQWFTSPRFAGIVRLYSPRQVAEQQGTISSDYTVARRAAEEFYARLRELFEQRRQITTFGPYSPGQAVMMKRFGMEGIYLGGWATSARGSRSEDPGPDLASYPLSQVPDEAAGLVRALLTADKNQHFAQGDPGRRLSAFHPRRRRHRSRRGRARTQSDPPPGRGRGAGLPHRRPEAWSEEVRPPGR